ncbi:MAG TPA: HAMP domain-containing sensor histidine kinase [Sphingomonas sp.]
MRGSFGRWLSVATAVMLAALAVLGLALTLGLGRADRLLDRAGRSQAQLALAYRLEADSLALMAPDPLLQRQAVPALDADLARYRASIVAETGTLGRAARAGQATETARAAALDGLAARMAGETGQSLTTDAASFRAIVRAIALREEGEALTALHEMHGLRRRATLIATALPIGLALLAGWLFATMRAGLVRPLVRLRRAAAAIGGGQADAAGPGFSDFAPLGEAIMAADREIVRQRTALADANRFLESQVAERTAALARQNERLAAIDATRRRFFSQVGHELRTPVTVIRGEAEVVLRDAAASAGRLREALDHIVTNGAFLGRRIDDLLAVARAEDGRLTIGHERVDLVEVARAVERIAAPYAASAGITLTVETPDGSLPVDGDASWLQQALLALIDNAVRHAAHGGGGIILSVGRARDAIQAIVADDGPGVSAELLPRLFDAWSQADGASGGSGLGLAVARWVAHAHGGTIAAANAPIGGLVVTIGLPIP